ncbi:MAG: hypothetical protein LJE84_10465 [Gammaproteobacteria bacterium]|jgi:hypothetical protein|nr:hypothetical protein [Gammaproteobacteria bacterium]
MAKETSVADLVREHLELQREFNQYVREHGFKVGEYHAPPPGSFLERYRKRWLEITHLLTPALHNPDE